MPRNLLLWLVATGAALLLNACGVARMVNTEVSTYQTPAVQTNNAQLLNAKLYWLERLPSQTSEAEQRMATMAEQALTSAGLQAAPSRNVAQLLVTLTTSQTNAAQAPPNNPTARTGFWFGTQGSGINVQFGIPSNNEQQHQLYWVFRAPNGEVLQEIKASQNGRWSDNDTVWQAMLNASLTDFPSAGTDKRVIKTSTAR